MLVVVAQFAAEYIAGVVAEPGTDGPAGGETGVYIPEPILESLAGVRAGTAAHADFLPLSHRRRRQGQRR